MPLYFFDIYANGVRTHDDEGVSCASLEQARLEAINVLPSIAKDEVGRDGDQQAFTVLMSDEAGKPVYA